jgi:exopolysaccharide biosynthesis WecB/TagA/CpsF family protein
MTAARISLGGCPIDLRDRASAVEEIRARFRDDDAAPLGVVSVNLDHVHHFGSGSRWEGTIDRAPLEWLHLIDGAPVATQAGRITGRVWPRLAGSDLIDPILRAAESEGVRVGFLGGSADIHDAVRERLARDYPTLQVSGLWSPSREELGDRDGSREIARQIAEADTGLLVVCLGKPRQEIWMAQHGEATGARVLLAFGAVIDFLANRVDRAPQWVAKAGGEWAWRLAREPRRLASRYLVDGPPAYRAVRKPPRPERPARIATGRFLPESEPAEIAIAVVTYNSARHFPALIESLRAEAEELRLRVIVADNGSTDATRDLVAAHPDIITVETAGNRGYATGINIALQRAGEAEAVLVLNPDLEVERGALKEMLQRLRMPDVAAVVPKVLEPDGTVYTSLRREPTIGRAVGDALMGSRLANRPAFLSEIDTNAESYQHAHRVEWATGAAVLMRREVAKVAGRWDARFFLYSEETDYFRRLRDLGFEIWYEPQAVVRHDRGGSGTSSDLAALMAVNRVRYVRKHRPRGYAAAFHSAVILNEALRSYNRQHRDTLRVLLEPTSWRRLPHATHWPTEHRTPPIGAVIIPAHNEAAVIARTLRLIAPLAATGTIEVIVACNGCTDRTAAIARQFRGVRVVEIERPSKAAAMNAGDAVATAWPRLYVDADVEIHPGAVAAVFAELATGRTLAARPAFRYDTTGATTLVRSYYRARQRMPSSDESLWGAGAYALSEAGHARLGEFPNAIADDSIVDALFVLGEKTVVATEPVRVRTPRSLAGLLAILTRQRRGNLSAPVQSTTTTTVIEMLSSIRGPSGLIDAAVYAALTAVGRSRARRAVVTSAWERDESSRVVDSRQLEKRVRTVDSAPTHGELASSRGVRPFDGAGTRRVRTPAMPRSTGDGGRST